MMMLWRDKLEPAFPCLWEKVRGRGSGIELSQFQRIVSGLFAIQCRLHDVSFSGV